MDGLEAEFGDRIAFQRLNVDEPEGRLAAQYYRVRGHPTVLLLDANGKIVWSRLGVQPRQVYEDALSSLLQP
ncbi:MAG: hypothetical protein D6775_13375 [Caldilineae bacterium]|nr:MAG: hypothetical protein D6775_13375 [Caldilineae bacterium]